MSDNIKDSLFSLVLLIASMLVYIAIFISVLFFTSNV